MTELLIQRIWAMSNKWTFTIKPIKELLKEEIGRSEIWADPFAGLNSPAQISNDLNPEMPASHHEDALKFLKSIDTESVDGVLYDPPYSLRQAVECYKKYGAEKFDPMLTQSKYWSLCKHEAGRIVKPRGKAICFGWNTGGLGMCRNFQLTRVMIINHGGSKNDTLITVEIKTNVKQMDILTED